MAKWKYDITAHGKALREAINDDGEDYESCKETLRKLIFCIERIKQLIPEDDFNSAFSDILEDAQIFLESEPDCDEDEQDAVENVDYLLSEFYDACDAYRIWIGA